MIIPLLALPLWLFWLAAPLAAYAIGHALLRKGDPRSAWGWIAVCLLTPLLGPPLYFLFGVNRVQARGAQLKRDMPFSLTADGRPDPHAPHTPHTPHTTDKSTPESSPLAQLPDAFPDAWRNQAALLYALTMDPLTTGNVLDIFENGEEAYPAMLHAIEHARRRVFLATYLFDNDETGRQFIEALTRAMRRGCDVRVVIDGMGGVKVRRESAASELQTRGVPCERFLSPRIFPPSIHLNLRCHQKILLVDDDVGFTGGMNISDRHRVRAPGIHAPTQDVHFRVRGPVLTQMEAVFLWLWGFVTGQATTRPAMTPPTHDAPLHCRMLADGPDKTVDSLTLALTAAIHAARRRVTIVTPYFLPPPTLQDALKTADVRGVQVRVVIPEKNDQPWIHRATCRMAARLLGAGVEIYLQPPPFAHTKLFMVDGEYAMVGSANMDSRSLRLNFELTMEVYDGGFVEQLEAYAETRVVAGTRLTYAALQNRSLPTRLVDGACWLLSPYL